MKTTHKVKTARDEFVIRILIALINSGQYPNNKAWAPLLADQAVLQADALLKALAREE